MEVEKSCLNCAFCDIARDIQTPTGYMCMKQDDRWFPDGIPDKRICEKHRFSTGITIREKLGENALVGLWIMCKSNGWSREMFDRFSEQDSAWIGD